MAQVESTKEKANTNRLKMVILTVVETFSNTK